MQRKTAEWIIAIATAGLAASTLLLAIVGLFAIWHQDKALESQTRALRAQALVMYMDRWRSDQMRQWRRDLAIDIQKSAHFCADQTRSHYPIGPINQVNHFFEELGASRNQEGWDTVDEWSMFEQFYLPARMWWEVCGQYVASNLQKQHPGFYRQFEEMVDKMAEHADNARNRPSPELSELKKEKAPITVEDFLNTEATAR